MRALIVARALTKSQSTQQPAGGCPLDRLTARTIVWASLAIAHAYWCARGARAQIQAAIFRRSQAVVS